MSYPSYKGLLDQNQMPKKARKAYRIWCLQRKRHRPGNNYSSREFIGWWLHNLKTREWENPTCGRIDHTKPYSFNNIEMQEMVDNVKERNARWGNPGCAHRSVRAKIGKKSLHFPSTTEAAKFFGVDVKTVFVRCQKIEVLQGSLLKLRDVVFSWA